MAMNGSMKVRRVRERKLTMLADVHLPEGVFPVSIKKGVFVWQGDKAWQVTGIEGISPCGGFILALRPFRHDEKPTTQEEMTL